MQRRHAFTFALGAPIAAMAVFSAGFTAGLATADPGPPTRAERPHPDWFLPIWDAYDRNPAITPEFDFAALYSMDPSAARTG